jgi:hypothetical protein
MGFEAEEAEQTRRQKEIKTTANAAPRCSQRTNRCPIPRSDPAGGAKCGGSTALGRISAAAKRWFNCRSAAGRFARHWLARGDAGYVQLQLPKISVKEPDMGPSALRLPISASPSHQPQSRMSWAPGSGKNRLPSISQNLDRPKSAVMCDSSKSGASHPPVREGGAKVDRPMGLCAQDKGRVFIDNRQNGEAGWEISPPIRCHSRAERTLRTFLKL